MIQLDIREEDLENEKIVAQIANKIITTRIIEGENQKLQKCFDFYDGKQPLIQFKDAGEYESKVINLTKPIVDIATQTFIGEMPDIIIKGNKKEKDKVSNLSQKLYDANFDSHFYECCKYSSKTGSGYIAIYNKNGDTFPRFRELNPRFTECVYDCTLEKKHILSYHIVEVNSGDSNNIGIAKYVIYIYTKKYIYAFESPITFDLQTTKPDTEKRAIVKPYFAWEKGGTQLNKIEHGYVDIPIIEVPNNAEYKGDAECVFDLIALYNGVQNNRCKNVYDVVNYILMIKNVRLGDKEETKKVISMLKEYRILPTEGEDTDAKFLSNPLNQQELQVLANDILNQIHTISRVPDLSSVDFSQNASDPIIKIKTKPLLDLCKEKEKQCNYPFKRLLHIVLEWCKINDGNYEDYYFDLANARFAYAHILPSNDTDMVAILSNLQNSKMANPEVLLQNFSFIPNVHEYIKGMNKWNDELDKRKKDSNNKDNGINETNIERHNEKKPLNKDLIDNKNNFIKGNSNVLDDING